MRARHSRRAISVLCTLPALLASNAASASTPSWTEPHELLVTIVFLLPLTGFALSVLERLLAPRLPLTLIVCGAAISIAWMLLGFSVALPAGLAPALQFVVLALLLLAAGIYTGRLLFRHLDPTTTFTLAVLCSVAALIVTASFVLPSTPTALADV